MVRAWDGMGARCRCGHSRGGHGVRGCALCRSCPGFRARLGERLRAAWAALRDRT